MPTATANPGGHKCPPYEILMNPEEKAREEIDRQLAACGWLVQDKAMNITAGPGVAVREFPLKCRCPKAANSRR